MDPESFPAEYETWADVPYGVMVKGDYGLYIKSDGSNFAFTIDLHSDLGFSGGWILSSAGHRPLGPFKTVTVAL